MRIELLIPFAKHVPSGKEVFIDDVERGLACNCVCIGCGKRLVARKGNEMAHHFAHQKKEINDDVSCPFTFDRCVFWMCRKVLSESSSICLPDYNAHYWHRHVPKGMKFRITDSSTISYNEIQFPNDLENNYDNDVAIISVGSHEIAIKLVLGNCLDFNNQWDYRRPYIHNGHELAQLQVNLSLFKECLKETKSNFRAALQELLIDSLDAKKWLYHPREESFRAEFNEKIEKALADIKKEKKDQQDFLLKLDIQKRKEAALSKENFKEISKTRLEELVRQAKEVFGGIVQPARRCNNCFFLSLDTASECNHCGGHDFHDLVLTPDYFYCIEKKYDQKGYVRNSLINFPPD